MGDLNMATKKDWAWQIKYSLWVNNLVVRRTFFSRADTMKGAVRAFKKKTGRTSFDDIGKKSFKM